MEQDTPKPRKYRGNIWMGCLFLLIGAVLLMRQAGYPFPNWLFSWQVILITVGVFVGIKNRFRDFSWLIMIVIGLVFMSDVFIPGIELKKYTVPIILLLLGVFFLFAPKGHGTCRHRRLNHPRFREKMMERKEEFIRQRREGFNPPVPGEDSAIRPENVADRDNTRDNTIETDLDIVSFFGGVKKKVLSKEFRGGEIVCVFGGAQINLSNADFTSPVELELVQIFGGTKLVVPANWEIRSEIAAIFGGVDDKRPPTPANLAPEKTLILKGTLIFGGVEVNSF